MQSLQKEMLAQFGQGCVALRDQLEGDADFGDTERLYIENCIVMIELSYIAWKYRKSQESSPPPPLAMPSGDTSGSTPTVDA
jgi:hypothetical protein